MKISLTRLHPTDAKKTLLFLLVLGVCPLTLKAQELSYDGKRWFEVELSIFTNEYPRSEYSEQAVAKNLSLQYLPKLQKLLTPISSLLIDFPAPDLPAELLPPEPVEEIPQPDPPRNIGPVYSPALKDGFKVNDYARDPYIALADRLMKFNSINRNIDGSFEHQVLWHQVWRQPLQTRAQTPAIFVVGGEQLVNHAELEGSLRLSDISGQATLDLNLWLNRFGMAAEQNDEQWIVPELPLALNDFEEPVLETMPIVEDPRSIIEVWQMEQTQEIGADELYYLDHPAFGVLIQLRPYLLPEQIVTADEGDF